MWMFEYIFRLINIWISKNDNVWIYKFMLMYRHWIITVLTLWTGRLTLDPDVQRLWIGGGIGGPTKAVEVEEELLLSAVGSAIVPGALHNTLVLESGIKVHCIRHLSLLIDHLGGWVLSAELGDCSTHTPTLASDDVVRPPGVLVM
jgi:hypothetical protein